MKKNLFLILISLALSACSLLSPVPNTAPNEYMIDTMPQSVIKKSRHHGALYVPLPQSSVIVNTSLMAYKEKAHEISYFSKNRWAATPAQMLQPLIVDTLQKTKNFRAVGGTGTPGNYDYLLNTQILVLQQEFYSHGSVVKMKLRAQLVKVSTNQIIKVKEFEVIERAPYYSPYGGVIAANRATAKILSQLAKWSVGS